MMMLKNKDRRIFKIVLMVLIVLLLLGLIFFFVWRGLGKSDTKSSTNSSTDTVVEKKVYEVGTSSNNVSGRVGVEIKTSGKVRAYYFLKFVTDLEPNWVCRPNMESWACTEYVEYNYAGDLVDPSDSTDDSEGAFSAFYCNFDAMPEESELFDMNYRGWSLESCGGTIQTSVTRTNHFNSIFSMDYDSLNDFFAANVFNVHNAHDFWEAKDANTSVMNTDRAVAETEPIKTFNLNFTEVD